jgi:hypothetical protein
MQSCEAKRPVKTAIELIIFFIDSSCDTKRIRQINEEDSAMLLCKLSSSK